MTLAVSVLLLAFTVAAWIRGYSVGDTITRETSTEGDACVQRSYAVASDRGQVWWSYRHQSHFDADGRPRWNHLIRRQPPGEAVYHWSTWPTESDDLPGRPWHGFEGETTTTSGAEAGSVTLPDGSKVRIATYSRVYAVPHWFLVLLFGTFPALALVGSARRRARVRAGCCLQCGYDLRGHPPEAARCPECGVAIADSVASQRRT